MGFREVNTVYTRWTHLPHVPFRALVYMAHMAHHDHTPPPYFGGHGALADAMGYPQDGPKREEQVRRLLRQLEDAGAIVAGMDGKAGQRRDYALTLDPAVTYRGRGVHNVTFGKGDETYVVRLTDWEERPRDDPRPQTVPPGEMGGDPPHEVGGRPPREMGGDPPHEVGETPHTTGGPTGTHNHSTGKPRPESTATALTSQLNPGTRGRETAAGDDDVLTLEDDRNRQADALRNWERQHWTDDAHPSAPA